MRGLPVRLWQRLMGARPRLTLGARLAVSTCALLALFAVGAVIQMTATERDRRFEARISAGQATADLYAELLRPPLVFEDPKTAEDELTALVRTHGAIGADAWLGTAPGRPFAHVGASGADEAMPTVPGVATRGRVVEITRTIVDPDGAPIGALRLRLSLEADEHAFVQARERILATTCGVAAALGLALLFSVRRMVVLPLARLARAARSVAAGDFSVRVPATGRDEIGALSQAYNDMVGSLVDRDQRLAAVDAHLRDLLDNMRQGVLAVDREGRVAGETSREARALFGDTLDRAWLRDLLYPGRDELDLDVIALGEWIAAAFELPPERWAECEALAPRTATVARGGGQRLIDLEFRPVVRDGVVARVLLLARDVTREHELEEQVREHERDHARRLASMRRLLAGGAQIVVSFVAAARDGLGRVAELVRAAGGTLPPAVIDEAFQLVHVVKGEARACDFDVLAERLHALEDVFDQFRARATGAGCVLNGSEVADLAKELELATAALEQGVETLVQASPVGRAVLDQITVQRSDLDALGAYVAHGEGSLAEIQARLAARPFGELVGHAADAAPAWAAASGKQVCVEVEGRELGVPPALAAVLPALVVQLMRNAVAHGVGTPEERAERGKEPRGTIRIVARATPAGPVFAVEDDGGLFDEEAIAARAGGQRSEAAELAFAAGVSSRSHADELAGRGMGLAAVRRASRRVGYDARLEYERDRFVRVCIAPWRAERGARAVPRQAMGA